jgi:hypothetical protein
MQALKILSLILALIGVALQFIDTFELKSQVRSATGFERETSAKPSTSWSNLQSSPVDSSAPSSSSTYLKRPEPPTSSTIKPTQDEARSSSEVQQQAPTFRRQLPSAFPSEVASQPSTQQSSYPSDARYTVKAPPR